MSLFTAITSLLAPINDLVDNIHTSEEEKLEARISFAKIQLEIQQRILDYESEVIKAKAAIITAEAQGNWLSKSWRPILMLSITAMLVNNYILLVYLPGAKPIDFPPELFTLLTVGVGGYVVGRSGEKMVKFWKSVDGNTSKSPE